MPVERESPLEPSEPGRRADSPGGAGASASTAHPSGGLVAALRAGDPAVLDRLLEAHGPELGGVAFLILRDRAEAEDVVVDTLLTALERGAELRDGAALRSWLLRIATNRALGRLRRRRRIVGIEVVGEESDDVFDPARATTRATVLNAVNRLPPRMRAAVVLRYYAGCPVAEVAAILGRSPNTVKSELRVALERLRADLGPEAVAEGRAEDRYRPGTPR